MNFKEQILNLYSLHEYRPVQVVVLYRKVDCVLEFLLVHSTKGIEEWAFPQEGIDAGESLEENLARGLREELGIDTRSEVVNIHYFFHGEQLDAEPSRKDKRGFTKGKIYFYTFGEYIGDSIFHLQTEEIVDAKWCPEEEAVQYLSRGRKEKAVLSTRVLNQVLSRKL